MKTTLLPLLTAIFLGYQAQAQQTVPTQVVEKEYIERVLNTLASDDMRGRHALSADAERAADFLATEFQAAELKPYTENGFKQTFSMTKIARKASRVEWGGKELSKTDFLILGNNEKTSWSENSEIKVVKIQKSDDFATKFREYARSDQDIIVLVDPSYAPFIARYNKIYDRDNISNNNHSQSPTKAFILAEKLATNYTIHLENDVTAVQMSNVAAVLPGKSKPNEYVVFSAHYDHIGIIPGNEQDSIANGADDDASGTTAVLSLAKYYKQQDNNERTLIFVAFTAEEIGMYGSRYFSNNINADDVVAMINIEMIGKDAKFGPNSLYITGFDRSNLGELMQKNLQGSSFNFHPDPYPQQNLFYRSDNKVLAELGVPAHTFSTSQIDNDTYYHTVKDEVETLNIENIKSSIEAIALGANGIVNGTQTPTRVEKLKD